MSVGVRSRVFAGSSKGSRPRVTRPLASMVAVSLVLGVVAGGLVRPAGGYAADVCDGVAGSEADASRLAVSCAEPVVVDGSRTEFSQVVAQPDGRMQFESGVVPQRAYKAGKWADVSLVVGRGTDGWWRPGVSVADVAFSNGGSNGVSNEFVRLNGGGRTMAMSWPGVLPAPVVSGESLTYPNVFTDVDLVVRATRTGFTHTLVVKSPTSLSKVGEVRFVLSGDAEVRSDPDGVRVMAGRSVIASTAPAVMWDSRTVSPAAARSKSASVSASTPSSAGDAARVAPVAVEVSGNDLVLRPDPALLNARDATFPLFVDPQWSVAKSKWAYATNNGSSNSDVSTARVGLSPDTGAVYRSFFHFPTSANGVSLKDKYIRSGRVEMKLDHSWSCDKTVTSMYWTSGINATPKATWSKMDLLRYLNSATGRANEAGGCGSIQADMILNFQGAAVTTFVQDAARGGWGALGVGFTARDGDGSGEATQNRWKKFLPNDAKLFVDYDTRPAAANGLQVANVNCRASEVLTVGTPSPTFSAVFPDEDRGADSLTGQFEWIEVPAAGMGAVTDSSPGRKAAPPNKTGVTPYARATTAAVTVVKNRTYAFRARSTDKAPYSQVGPWSPWCQFSLDASVPSVSARKVIGPPGPGMLGRFRIESTDSDVVSFQYGWGEALTSVPAQGANPKFAEVDVTAPHFGTNVLYVKAIDATGNEGNGSVEFEVGPPARPLARWGLEAYPGVSEAAGLHDRASVPVDSPLTASNVAWAPEVRVWGGKTATFNGTSSQASAPDSVVNTANSFSVAAWVRLGALPSSDMTFAALEGSDAAGFELGVRRTGSSATPYWSFVMKDTGAQSSATRMVLAAAPITAAEVNRWTHVTGVFDATERVMRLFVDGRQMPDVSRSAQPWSASGKFVLGRGFAGGVAAGWWNGSIADVQVFDRVLVSQDFTGQRATEPGSTGFAEPGILSPLRVGDWNFEQAFPCKLADLRDTCQAPDPTTAFDRWLALTPGSEVGAGHLARGNALWLDDKYFPSDGGSPPSSSQEYGRSAQKTGLTAPDSDGNEFTTWQDRPVLRTEQSFTISAWATLNRLDGGPQAVVSQTGAHESGALLRYNGENGKWEFVIGSQDNSAAAYAVAGSNEQAVQGWTHLVGVYDAGARQIRLYVNGTLQGESPRLSFTPMASTGPLVVGHTRWRDQLVNQWFGGIDDVGVFQGAMTSAAVDTWYNQLTSDTSDADTLHRDQTMVAGDSLVSKNGEYVLRMQHDGNLVLYHGGPAVWKTDTMGTPGAYLIMQGDGNLVLYRNDRYAVWNTGTWGTTGDRLVLSDNGDLAVLDVTGQVLWHR